MSDTRTFQQIVEAAGYDTRAYSGRGMYGKTCLAITMDDEPGILFADVLGVLEPEENEVAAHAFRRMRTDSLGRSTVVYFPGIGHE